MAKSHSFFISKNFGKKFFCDAYFGETVFEMDFLPEKFFCDAYFLDMISVWEYKTIFSGGKFLKKNL